MIPKQMQQFLQDRLPRRTWRNRLQRQGALAFMEFGPLDVDRLRRLEITVDALGPYLVVCMWDEESPLEIGGYLVIDNLSMGRPAMGGIRMLPDITPATIFNLARGMTLKNAAAGLPYGGGKSGIVAPRHLAPQDRDELIRGFARLIFRYRHNYLPGPDVGTDDTDMKTIAIENGLDGALSKPADMGGNCIDELGGAARGVVIGIESLLGEIERLQGLPQFAGLRAPAPEELTVLVQGFGAVGAHVARLLSEGKEDPPRIVGISDASGYLFDACGLPVRELLATQQAQGVAARPYYHSRLSEEPFANVKFCNAYDDLLRESAFCLVPAAPVANYLDVDDASGPSMTVERMGRWSMIVEGANTYSPDPARRAARARLERTVYWQEGVLIATDFLVNSGGVIYAAQEHLIQAPEALRIPEERLGDRQAVEAWLMEHRQAFAALAERRRQAAEAQLQRVIPRNMKELVDQLVADPDCLPCEAAEQIAIRRIASSERDRTVADVMEAVVTILEDQSVRAAAERLVNTRGDLLAVISADGDLSGVVTEWDITRASATARAAELPLCEIMTRDVVAASPEDSILDVVRKLEHHEISAMPVVTGDGVAGVISSDILARRTLYRLLQSQESTLT